MWFKNITKEKKLIDRELEVYRKEEIAKITQELSQNYLDNRKQISKNEHDFHSEKERLGIELAKLEAQKETYVSHLEKKMECYTQEYKAVNLAKDKTIEVLENALKNLTEKIPTQINNITTNNK